MNRRDFLKYCSVLGASVALGKTSAYADWLTNEKRNGFPQGMLLIDAHAHPDQLYYMGPREGDQWDDWCAQYCDDSSTLEKIIKLGMHGSCFAALGDSGNTTLDMDQVKFQIQKVINLEKQGLVRIVRRHEDMPHGAPPKGYIPGAILSLEGATPLGEDLNNVDELYNFGVRMITLMHNLVNQIGYIMTEVPPNSSGLTPIGVQIIERMIDLGIIVDVAHAHFNTLQEIAEIARNYGVPIIDSHTSLTHTANYGATRRRTFDEMKMVAETGGVICTWPASYAQFGFRKDILDWAEENLEIAREIGIEHVGLGTDGGGVIPTLLSDYESILDLPKLVEAMYEVGFKRSEIVAYMGGNLSRVIKKCIG